VDLLVNLQPGADRDAVAAAIQQQLSSYPQLTVWTGERMRSELMGILGQVLAVLQGLGFIVALLAVLMGVTSSSAGLITRTRESALLRLTGATRRWLSGSLIVESVWLGLMAWAIAVVCGMAAVKPMIDAIGTTSKTYPPTVLPVPVALAMAPLAVAAMLLAVWLPSRRMLDADVARALTEET
jgi:putative ABC transport system permease protein